MGNIKEDSKIRKMVEMVGIFGVCGKILLPIVVAKNLKNEQYSSCVKFDT